LDPSEDFDFSPLGLSLAFRYGRCRFLNDTDHFLSTACWLPYQTKAELFEENVWEAIEEDSAVFSLYEDFFERHAKCSCFDRRMHLFAEYNLESLLHRIDNSSMAASIEARVPFTDYRLAEFAFRMPDSYKMGFRNPADAAKAATMSAADIDREGMLESKRLPRNAFKASLPKAIVERPKKSFPVPVSSWMRGALAKEIEGICLESPLAKGIFKRNELERALKQGGEAIWPLANACKWASWLESQAL
jgi:asparagine synthase (glutamine-hydrolysing)